MACDVRYAHSVAGTKRLLSFIFLALVCSQFEIRYLGVLRGDFSVDRLSLDRVVSLVDDSHKTIFSDAFSRVDLQGGTHFTPPSDIYTEDHRISDDTERELDVPCNRQGPATDSRISDSERGYNAVGEYIYGEHLFPSGSVDESGIFHDGDGEFSLENNRDSLSQQVIESSTDEAFPQDRIGASSNAEGFHEEVDASEMVFDVPSMEVNDIKESITDEVSDSLFISEEVGESDQSHTEANSIESSQGNNASHAESQTLQSEDLFMEFDQVEPYVEQNELKASHAISTATDSLFDTHYVRMAVGVAQMTTIQFLLLLYVLL
ncbi:DOCK family protein [Perkinsela sp. CCAP 1560/4]|nr:DOCK family protein [Perkinsela sp. CCAP 1560/4]|eukprot:KNH04450.1 DOCK family protein [Perkinsela sp. CCAP 1560/4]